ncbi:MAG TPA: hypothetical protein VLT45_31870 [Kofleriaceae bacterium]|nr:hypothetical protein [Kofleriaceae bacterium]
MREYLLVLLAACTAASGGDAPARLELDRPTLVRYHMQRHFSDLRDIERMLLAGRLDDARARAFLLTKTESDRGLDVFDQQSLAVSRAAAALVAAPSIPDACRLEAQVAAKCAGCHVFVPKVLPLPAVPITPDAQMARHAWAADRLWEGVVLADARRWRAGLDVFALTGTDRIQQLARDALGSLEMHQDTIETRATTYGELLVACANCHARSRK